MSNGNNGIYILNFTKFFNRELMMYSFGDVRFPKPVALKKVGYIIFFFVVWTLPLFFTFGAPTNVYWGAFMLVPPVLIGHYATKPLWGGRTLPDFARVTFNFLSQPKVWTDIKAVDVRDGETFFVEKEIWISRRRELNMLAEMKENLLLQKSSNIDNSEVSND